ncbi:MatE family transporter [Pusillimonas sp. SM2304]|uniref:MatE family transporter n=1 Tax=Pusillimonas sp. SM2304 TaxID=3073241 RepID=UPI002876A119|nr:MatE family transporter [Pusillimonas sp. SM2304]MDS1140464.1 MatE family transporter [Pusillimonas sp. SM2304]
MVTDKDLELARQDKDEEEANVLKTGLTEPALGPSDSSDSGNDLPANQPDTDSDRHNTGERPQVENTGEAPLEDDVEPDRVVSESEAGLAYTPPDPERNGG